MQKLESPPGRTALVNGKSYLYFSGTAYLGIPAHPVFQSWVQEGFQRFGTSYGGSRLSSTRFDVYEKAEQQLATVTTAPTTISVSSGTLAGQLVVRILSQKHDFFYAPGTHPALFRETIPPTISDRVSWETKCIDIVNNSSKNAPVLLSNSLDPLYAKSYDFSWLQQLKRPAILVLDDSHGIGITGENGGGIFSQLQLPEHIELIVVASLGKAFGIPGGVILGNEQRIATLLQSPFFGGASPAIPAYLYAFLQAQALYAKLRSDVQARIRQFVAFAKEQNHFSYVANYPVFYSPNHTLAAQLAKQGILISSFSYPTANDPAITRIILNALHTTADIDSLVEALQK